MFRKTNELFYSNRVCLDLSIRKLFVDGVCSSVHIDIFLMSVKESRCCKFTEQFIQNVTHFTKLYEKYI